jgi:hypothetical protein
MHSRYLIIAGGLVFATACAGRDAKKADSTAMPPAPVVSMSGYDLIRIGETAHDLATTGDSAAALNPKHAACRFAHPKSFPLGAKIMLLEDVVVRIDIDSVGIRTAEGAQVGDPELRVLELYRGRIASLPHKYIAGGHNLVVRQQNLANRIVFETDGRKVLRYRVGRPPGVDFVEGCA